MLKFNLHFSKRSKVKARRLPGAAKNDAGGYSYAVAEMTMLRRFLILGTENGTYYASEKNLTVENAKTIEKLIKQNPQAVVGEIVSISKEGRSAKNDACLFALAMVAGLADTDGRKAALAALPEVARTSTHLFTFANYVQSFRGWGRALRQAVALWYTARDENKLAVQLTKYQARNGFSHRDLLRLSHPVAKSPAQNVLFKYAVKGVLEDTDGAVQGAARETIDTFERLKQEALERKLTDAEIAALVKESRLSIEMVPTALRSAKVYEVLAEQAGLEWLLRNLGNLSRHGVLTAAKNDMVAQVVQRLTNAAEIKKAKLHPVKILAALITYRSGQGFRGDGHWEPVAKVVDALNEAFYESFNIVQATGKRLCLGLDVSGSMAGTLVCGTPGLSAREACAAMAMVTAKVEKDAHFIAFDTKDYALALSPKQRLDDIVNVLARTGGGGTDCALPMLWAANNKVPVDTFVIYTDSQTWSGDTHPIQALNQYRDKTGIDATLVIVAMATNKFSLGDFEDRRVLNVIGFDTNTPAIIAQFVSGDL